MNLLCSNADCEHVCPEYEAAGPYQAPECPRCWSEMRPFDAPLVSFAMNDVELMFSFPDATPAEELAVPAQTLFRRQA